MRFNRNEQIVNKKKSIASQEEDIRQLLLPHLYKTIAQGDPDTDQSETFKQFLTIMAAQPQWAHKLDNIIAFRVVRRKRYKSLLLQIKVIRCAKWLTVSWKKGVHTKRKAPDPLKQAMRNAVSRQSRSWGRDHWDGKKCVECESTELLQVDHMDPQFHEIRDNFLVDFTNLPKDFKQGPKGSYFLPTDSSFSTKWKKYHKSLAEYQWLCRSCNCKKQK